MDLLELAERIGVIQSIESALERDERKLPDETAVRFAHAFGVSRRHAQGTEDGELMTGCSGFPVIVLVGNGS